MSVPLVVLGLGRVGSSFIRQVLRSKDSIWRQYGLRFDIRLASDTKGVWKRRRRGSFNEEILIAKENGESLKTFSEYRLEDPFQSIPEYLSPRHADIVVDCTAAHTHPLLLTALNRGCGVVIANKKPLTGEQAVFDDLILDPFRLGYESTVGAGTPFIASLNRILAAGDKVLSIKGCLSGTLGFVMSSIESGSSFSKAVRDAHEKGYTEPDPRDDLSGMDVARKALIFARSCGYKCDLSQIQLQSLYPTSVARLSTQEFLNALPELDAYWAGLKAQALKETKDPDAVLRYVAEINTQPFSIKVGLKALNRKSPIGNLQGTDNLVEYTTSIYRTKPLVIQGAGAGPEVTASGLLADCVQVASAMQIE